ncbi:MAG: serine/threonine protein kinase [Proteobacteria bacterium]|nr:serine/threonine protein kinase [Pseudomonadota bacterium]MCP4915304.1 serine/threonine protein kinase [Pseudomonadota bacterium]
MTGRIIAGGRLVLTDTIGEGGMASVVRAWDEEAGLWRAVKLLAPALARSTKVRRRFQQEAEVMRDLDHPGIAKVLAFGDDAGLFWIEMELIRGRSLFDWSRTYGAMPSHLAVGALIQVCEAVQAAHAAGVIHRDLKPANVLVGPDERCRVVDFGIARLKDNASITRTGLTMGSYGYMAPEQIADAKSVDERADVFSLGVLLGVLLTDRDPRELDPVLQAVSERVDPQLAMTVVRATTTDRAHRTASVEALARALGRLELPRVPAPSLHLPLTSSS